MMDEIGENGTEEAGALILVMARRWRSTMANCCLLSFRCFESARFCVSDAAVIVVKSIIEVELLVVALVVRGAAEFDEIDRDLR